MKKIAIIASVLTLSLGLFACNKEVVPEEIEVPVETPVEAPVETPVEEPEEEEPVILLKHRYDTPQPGLSPLTGLPYEGDGKVIMVQIENTVAARPHSGLAEADLIYEIEVESTITRLTAFFKGNYPEKVGPVRSARKQQMFLWSEWDYLYVFYGGSTPQGQNIYEWMNELDITARRVDGMRDNIGFSRSADRKAPHNAYTNLNKVLTEAYDFDPVDRTLYFDEQVVKDGLTAKKVSLAYRNDNIITYEYNDESMVYQRFINEKPMMDKESDKQIAVKNIIVQHANHFHVTNTVYTNIDLIGTGDAEYFIDGVMKKGTWERADENSMTRNLDEEGNEIAFKPGKTFIQIMRNDSEVTFE
ncbi:MAG TPA: DUF3048 domain-containing protein [Proteiniclasticum sp.]|nr:DUF3048 domain-containing protein [Proteiniclasticum sp.]